MLDLLRIRALRLVLIIHLFWHLAASSLMIIPKWLHGLGYGEADIGLAMGVAGVSSLIFTPLAGSLLDRWNRPTLLRWATAVAVPLTVLLPWAAAQGKAMIWGLRVAQGLAFGLAFPVAGALVADLAPAAARVRALGLFGIVTQLTQAGAPALAEALAVGLGYPTVFGFAAGAAAVASVLTWPLGRRMVRHDTQTSVDSNHGPRPKESTLQQQLALATIVVGTGVTYGAVVTFAPVLLLKLGATSVGPFFAAVSLASVAVRALFGGLGDRVNQDSLISWSGLGATLAVVGAAMLAAAAPSAHAVPLGVLLGIAFGCSAGMFYPVANVRYLELGTARDRGRRMAYYAATYAAGITAGNLVLGFAAERWGFAVMYAVVAALHAAAGLWFWTATRS